MDSHLREQVHQYQHRYLTSKNEVQRLCYRHIPYTYAEPCRCRRESGVTHVVVWYESKGGRGSKLWMVVWSGYHALYFMYFCPDQMTRLDRACTLILHEHASKNP